VQDKSADLCLVVAAREALGRADLREKGSTDLLQTYQECSDAVQALRVTDLEAHLNPTV